MAFIVSFVSFIKSSTPYLFLDNKIDLMSLKIVMPKDSFMKNRPRRI